MRPSKLQMKRIAVSVSLLLCVASVTIGCKTIPDPQTTRTDGNPTGAANEDKYDRSYQTEAHHRHHHGRRDESRDDNWTNYDRAETADDPSGRRNTGAYLPDGNEWRNGNSSPARHPGRHHSSRALAAAPGQFDFYLLNLSWSPEFCHGHPEAAECAQHRAFTLHGLWPQNNAGTYPEDCSEASGPASPSQYADIYPDPALLQHEWQMHGTCSGLKPDQFLSLARRAEQSIHIPAELSNLTQQIVLTPAQLTTLITQSNPAIPPSSLAISCGNNNLTAVEVCLDKNLQPANCSAVKTCRADQIRIPPPR